MARVRALVESLGEAAEAAAQGQGEGEAAAPTDPNHQKLTDFWLSANDEATIEARGIEPLVAPLHLASAVADAPAGSAERATALGIFMAQVSGVCGGE